MAITMDKVYQETIEVLSELLTIAKLKPGQIVVIGCSTSEVLGAKIGSAGSDDIAAAIMKALQQLAGQSGIELAVQCCEHLNRALVVERHVMEIHHWEQVCVRPVPHAGGALASCAMKLLTDAVVVEEIQADAGLDIGQTLIGMHLRKVAVPVRLRQCTIGQAAVAAARTRPKLIGGARAQYE